MAPTAADEVPIVVVSAETPSADCVVEASIGAEPIHDVSPAVEPVVAEAATIVELASDRDASESVLDSTLPQDDDVAIVLVEASAPAVADVVEDLPAATPDIDEREASSDTLEDAPPVATDMAPIVLVDLGDMLAEDRSEDCNGGADVEAIESALAIEAAEAPIAEETEAPLVVATAAAVNDVAQDLPIAAHESGESEASSDKPEDVQPVAADTAPAVLVDLGDILAEDRSELCISGADVEAIESALAAEADAAVALIAEEAERLLVVATAAAVHDAAEELPVAAHESGESEAPPEPVEDPQPIAQDVAPALSVELEERLIEERSDDRIGAAAAETVEAAPAVAAEEVQAQVAEDTEALAAVPSVPTSDDEPAPTPAPPAPVVRESPKALVRAADPADRATLIRQRWAETGIRMWNPRLHGTGDAALNIQGRIELLPPADGEKMPRYDKLEFRLLGGQIVCEGIIVEAPVHAGQRSFTTLAERRQSDRAREAVPA